MSKKVEPYLILELYINDRCLRPDQTGQVIGSDAVWAKLIKGKTVTWYRLNLRSQFQGAGLIEDAILVFGEGEEWPDA